MLNLSKINIILLILFSLLVLIVNYKTSFYGYAKESDPYTRPHVFKNIITPDEANYILSKAIPLFEESTILSGINSSVRKSKTAWLYHDDPVVYNIYSRLSKQFNFEIPNTEPLQIVKYEPGGYYNEHHDSCCDDNDHCKDFYSNGGQRKLTILVYLNDDFEGGATYFPKLDLSIKAPKYGAVIFHPLDDNDELCHPLALHKGTEVTFGVKYICNIWVRQKKI